MIGKVRQRDDRKQDRHEQARSTRFKVPDGARWSPWTEKKLSFSLAASALHLVVR
jgi:hypothetical protein